MIAERSQTTGLRGLVPPMPPDLYPRQHAAVADPARFVVIEASTKSGKTAGCLAWQYVEAINVPGVHRWVAPTYRMARDLGFRRAYAMLRRADPTGRVWSANHSDLEIRFVNRSIWAFKGAENVDGLYGEDVHSVVVDEATRCSEEAWIAIRSTLTATRGRARIVGNVRGRRNWVHQLAMRAQQGLPDHAYHRLTAYDAVEGGVLDAEEVEDARRTLAPEVFAELYLAEPSEDGSNPFGVRAIELATCDAVSTRPPVAFGVDLGRAEDYTAVVGLDDSGRVCSFDRWRRQSWDATIDRIAQRIGDVPTLIDATGVGDPIVESVRRIRPQVEPFVFTAQSKQDLMESLAVAVQSGRVSFPPGPIRDEMMEYQYEYTRRAVRYSAPAGLHDDCVCALALAVRRRGSAATSVPFGFRII